MAKEYNAKATIEAILSVSAKLFLQKGFDKTSMMDIATAAGISKGAIYHHFKSKDEIIKSVMEKQEQSVKGTIENFMEETRFLSGKEQLQLILEKNIENQEAHYLDDAMSVRMKSAEFVLSYMQSCVNKDSNFVSYQTVHLPRITPMNVRKFLCYCSMCGVIRLFLIVMVRSYPRDSDFYNI